MESDWEVEVGGDAPVIDGCWDGFVDLRFDPWVAPETIRMRAQGLAEVGDLSGLAEALVLLNGSRSQVWTAKCDVWPVLDAGALDAGELNAPWDEANHAWACYVDLLPKSDRQWARASMAVERCRSWCERLRAVPLSHSRVDLVVRNAMLAPDVMDHGITAYLTACGRSSDSAKAALEGALATFARTICSDSKVE